MKSKHCFNCREQIAAEHTFCMHCGSAQAQDFTCVHCKNTLALDSEFCNYCGKKTKVRAKRETFIQTLLVILLTILVVSIVLRIHIFRVLLLFVPVVVVCLVHLFLKKIGGYSNG